MSGSDYIKKAVELADGWTLCSLAFVNIHDTENHIEAAAPLNDLPQWFKDALAAQLVRQVDALDDYHTDATSSQSNVYREGLRLVAYSSGPDRTENTIKAIVDSGVLG